MTDLPPESPESDAAPRSLVNRTREIWELNAASWDERTGEGDDLQTTLVAPAVEGLLKIVENETVLDVACGNGAFARRLAARGVNVVACDFAETFIRLARSRDTENDGERRPIDYRVVDATDEQALLDLGEGRFDAVLCNMALMDMADIEPLFWAVPRLLTATGRFVFTIMHPAFNHQASHFLAENTRVAGGREVTHSLRVENYLSVPPARGLSMIGLPEASYTFHRPLSDILNAAFNAGLVMDGVAEPAFSDGTGAAKPFSWTNYPTIPPVFAARFRPGGSR
ncbi:MAG TPA: class I SAM-dependent methyltransferase [Longimicrobiales bacterium]|nr:class I SAM-dependent methyltransferase [Longimicrobiales bacterium]